MRFTKAKNITIIFIPLSQISFRLNKSKSIVPSEDELLTKATPNPITKLKNYPAKHPVTAKIP